MPQTPTPSATPQLGEATPPIVEVRSLTVDFETAEGRVRAIDGLDFDIAQRRTLGVVGESGCGKSVTARAIMRLEDERNCALGGSVVLHGANGTRNILTLKADGKAMRRIRGKDIALVFQEPMTSFSPVHTVGNQIIEAVRLHLRVGKAEARTRAIAQLRSVGTPHPEHIMEQYAWELSGGLRQRAMIAMALICGPQLLIADEPTTALDVTIQAQVLTLLRRLQTERHMALMLITHDLGVVAEIADDLLIMYLGTVAEAGPAEAVLRDPKHPYTRLLMQSLPRIDKKRGGRLRTIDGTAPRASHRPPGCPLQTRCPQAMSGICDVLPPARFQVGAGHFVSCHLYGDRTGTTPKAEQP